jgi:hypothetical protein
MQLTLSAILACVFYPLFATNTALAYPLQPEHGVARRAAGGGPYFVVYTDKFGGQTGPPPASKLKGYNVLALSFLQTNGAVDKVRYPLYLPHHL